jgi:hypothetical protein
MKVNKNSPAWTADYAIETEYGALECILSPEEVAGHFYAFFSSFAESAEDYNSASPSFEKYAEHAVELFARIFPERLKEMFEETVDEVRMNTLIKIDGISREEAREVIDAAVAASVSAKKERMNAPRAGRPPGSPSINTSKDLLHDYEERDKGRKRKILNAIRELYGREYIELETRKAVAQAIGITPKTLSSWMMKGGWLWDDLIAEGARGK